MKHMESTGLLNKLQIDSESLLNQSEEDLTPLNNIDDLSSNNSDDNGAMV
jgi:hypothetical protein